MVTAYSDAESAIRALQGGAYDFLSKPFHPDKLMTVLNRSVEKRRLLRERQVAERAISEREDARRR